MGLKPRAISLNRAVDIDDADRVKQLIDGGADVQERDYKGGSLLMRAHSGAVAALLAGAGVAVNDIDKHRWTALHYAAHSGNVDVVDALIKLGADVDAKTKEGQRPGDLASRADLRQRLGGSVAPANLHTVTNDELKADLESGDLEAARRHIKAGASLESYPGAGVWFCREAARAGRLDLIMLAKESGLAIDDNVALTNAVDNDHLEVAEFLLEHGAGPTALTWADKSLFTVVKSPAMARLLVESGVALDRVDKLFGTPLHRAASYGDPEIVSVLLEAGADPRAGDSYGDLAIKQASNARVRALLSPA